MVETTREELELKYNALWNKQHEYQTQMHAVQRQINEKIIEQGANYVGKTLKRTDRNGRTEYAMLIAAPYYNFHGTLVPHLNEYQLPALKFIAGGNEFPEFEYVFTGAMPKVDGVRAGNALGESIRWEWCEQKEFFTEFDYLVDRILLMLRAPAQYRDTFKEIYD